MSHRRERAPFPQPGAYAPRRPHPAAPHPLLALQATAGNAAVSALVTRTGRDAGTAVQRVDTPGTPGAEGAPAPAPTPTLRLHTITITVAAVDGSRVAVRCMRRAPGERWRVYVPPDGIDPVGFDAIADRLGVTPDDLDVTNQPSSRRIVGPGEPGPESGILGAAPPPPDPAVLFRGAMRLAVRYLDRIGVTTIDDTTAANVLDHVRMDFFQDGEWAEVLARNTLGGGDPAYTEAITTTQDKRGTRRIAVNTGNHTLPAIVHEMFHVLAANGIDRLWGGLAFGLVEAITEYWTTRATGIGYRCTRADGGTVYSNELGFLRHALGTGLVTEDQLRDGYFHGNLAPLKPLNDAFLAAQAASERRG